MFIKKALAEVTACAFLLSGNAKLKDSGGRAMHAPTMY